MVLQKEDSCDGSIRSYCSFTQGYSGSLATVRQINIQYCSTMMLPYDDQKALFLFIPPAADDKKLSLRRQPFPLLSGCSSSVTQCERSDAFFRLHSISHQLLFLRVLSHRTRPSRHAHVLDPWKNLQIPRNPLPLSALALPAWPAHGSSPAEDTLFTSSRLAKLLAAMLIPSTFPFPATPPALHFPSTPASLSTIPVPIQISSASSRCYM